MLGPLLALLLAADSPKFAKPVSLHAVTASSITFDFETGAPSLPHLQLRDDQGAPVKVELPREPRAHWTLPVQGLKANTHYAYVVDAGGLKASGAFWTAPATGSATPFTFAVVGDTRDHVGWAVVARSLLAKQPRFMLTTGDVNDRWGAASDYQDYYLAAQELFANVPVFAARGNHDTGDYLRFNPAPRSSSGSPLYYAFAYGNAGFVAVDMTFEGRGNPQMRAWLEKALTALSGGPLFAFQHHPLYSCGEHGPDAQLQQLFQPLFEKAHLTTDFAGHDHDLIDWKPVNGVRYVVSGGGGSSLYPLRDCAALFARPSFGFVIVSVAGPKVTETFFDGNGIELYRVGPFDAAGPSIPSKLGSLVAP